MYKSKIFKEYPVENKLTEFLNENKIQQEQIISISMSSDSNAMDRLCEHSVDRILLVWDDGVIYKTQKEKEDEREQRRREVEFHIKHQEEAWAQIQKSIDEIQASLEKS
jgi:hypothetical protein